MITIYVLEGCPYCNTAMKTLNDYNISFEKIVVKSKEKKILCTKKSGMTTFPQIYLNLSNKEMILIGGCDNLLNIVKYIKILKNNNISLEVIQFFYKKIYLDNN
jgi:glutaredoxin